MIIKNNKIAKIISDCAFIATLYGLLFFLPLNSMLINTHKGKLLVPPECIIIFSHINIFDQVSSVEHFISHNDKELSLMARTLFNNHNVVFVLYRQDNRLEMFSPQHGLLGIVYKVLFCNWLAHYPYFLDSCACFEKLKKS